MERTFDTNLILNDVYDNMDGTIRLRRFDSNYIFNAIYDPDAPGLRVNKIVGMNSTDLEDMPSTLVADKYLKVNSDGTAYELIGNFIEITHNELSNKLSSDQLIPGQWYLITDYFTFDFIRQSNTPVYEWHTGNVEQIFVQALSSNQLYPEGWSKDFPEEKIIYIPQRDLFIEYPSFVLDNGNNNGDIIVTPISSTVLEFTTVPYSVLPKDGDEFSTYIGYPDFGYEYNDSNKGVDWFFNEDNNFELINTHYDIICIRNIEYSTYYGNQGNQEIEITSDLSFSPIGSGIASFNDIYEDPDYYYYFYVGDDDTGAYNYYDYIGRGETWDVISGEFKLLDRGSAASYYIYYDYNDSTNVSIEDYNIIMLESISNFNIRKGSEQDGTTLITIYWNDSSFNEYGYWNYGTDWTYDGYLITFLNLTKDLYTDLDYLEGGIFGTDQTILINMEYDNVYISSEFYSQGFDLNLLDPVYISGGYTYPVPNSNTGLIVSRSIPKINLRVDVDYRGTKFRRYSANSLAYSSSTAYVAGNIVNYSNANYVCLLDNTNRQPSSGALYWMRITGDENNTVTNKYLGKDGISFSFVNPYQYGMVQSANITDQGGGYPVSSTFNIRVLAGDGNCTLSVTSNSAGTIDTINSVVTSGRGYVQNNSSYPYICSSTGAGSGVKVWINSTQQLSNSLILTANLNDYTDFDLFQDVRNVNIYNGLQVLKQTTDDLDVVLKASTQLNSIVKVNGGMLTLGTLINSNLTTWGYVINLNNLIDCNISSMNNVISYSLIKFRNTSILNSSIFYAESSSIDTISSSLLGYYGILNTTGINWSNVIIHQSNQNILNYLSYVLILATNFSGNYFNKVEFFTQIQGFSITQNLISGFLKRIWINSFFKSNVITSDCFYVTIMGTYFESNIINGLMGVETTGGNSIYPCLFDSFKDNNISGSFLNVVGKSLAFSGNTVKAGLSKIHLYRDGGFTFNVQNNTFLAYFYNLQAFLNNGSFSGNFISGACSNIIFEYGDASNKQVTDNTIMGRLLNLTITKGNVASNIFYNNFGTGGANTVNYNGTAISNSVFYGQVNGNAFNGLISGCVFNYICQANTFNAAIEYCIFEQNFIGNSFQGNVTRVTFTKQVNNTHIPVMVDNTYPSLVIKGKSDTGSTSAFSVLAATGGEIFKIYDNKRTTTNLALAISSFNIGGSISTTLVEKSSNYTLTINDYVVNCTANSFTVTLPSAASTTGRTYIIKNSGTGVITVDGEGTNTIDGELTQTLNQYDSLTIQSNGTYWIIIK